MSRFCVAQHRRLVRVVARLRLQLRTLATASVAFLFLSSATRTTSYKLYLIVMTHRPWSGRTTRKCLLLSLGKFRRKCAKLYILGLSEMEFVKKGSFYIFLTMNLFILFSSYQNFSVLFCSLPSFLLSCFPRVISMCCLPTTRQGRGWKRRASLDAVTAI